MGRKKHYVAEASDIRAHLRNAGRPAKMPDTRRPEAPKEQRSRAVTPPELLQPATVSTPPAPAVLSDPVLSPSPPTVALRADSPTSEQGEPTLTEAVAVLQNTIQTCHAATMAKVEELRIDFAILRQDQQKLRDRTTEVERRVGELEDLCQPIPDRLAHIQRRRRPFPLQINSYWLHGKLGKGGYGKVMRASLADSSERVTIEIMQKEDQNKELIEKEARLLEAVRGCPYLCQLHAAFQTEVQFNTDPIQLVWLSSISSTYRIYSSISRVFQHPKCAENLPGLILGDLKLLNILLTREGLIKIIDFGLAAENLFGQSATCGHAGTLLYMAPEVQKQRIKSILLDQPEYPAWLNRTLDFLQKLLEKDPKKRRGVNRSIRDHSLFEHIDWAAVESQSLRPPLPPEINDHSPFFSPTNGFICDPSTNGATSNIILGSTVPRTPSASLPLDSSLWLKRV
ncbi:hypothetical protein XELAEV_18002046mg [Xenopus laevis]|nr:hypothetical protein XELAEV_18002046mg [Xenopus laevis]